MNKGFTLIELLAVIAILSLVMSVGIVVYSGVSEKSDNDYYINLETNLKLAASEYFGDYRSLRPAVNLSSEEENACSNVKAKTLIDNGYIDAIKDSSGNNCDFENTLVYIKRNEDKQYEYKVLLSCNNYKNLLTNEEIDDYCLVGPNNKNSTILVSAYNNSGENIDVKHSSGGWNNENINVTFDSKVLVSKYVLTNRISGDVSTCDTLTDYRCNMTFNNYGNYLVRSYDNETLIDELNIYLRIDKDAPVFDINIENIYNIENGSTYKVNFSLKDVTDISGISAIDYKITSDKVNINKSSTKSNISENLATGIYNIAVKAYDLANNVSDWREASFKVTRKINLIDLEDSQYNGSFNVIDDYQVNYLGVNLPVLTKEGHTFDGWYTGATSGEKFENTSRVTDTINALYARWN